MQPTQAYFAASIDERLQINRFNVNHTLDMIKSNIGDGEYMDDYSFNIDVYKAFAQYKDINTQFYPTCALVFIYQNQFPLLAVSETIDSSPSIHLAKFEWSKDTSGYNIVPGEQIIEINGTDAITYLQDFANTSPDIPWVDFSARWNSLFVHRIATKSPHSQEISFGTFAERKTWNEERFMVKFADNTMVESHWLAKIDPRLHDVAKYRGLPFVDEKTFLGSFCTLGNAVSVYDQGFTLPSVEQSAFRILAPEALSTSPDGDIHSYLIKGNDLGDGMRSVLVINNQFLYSARSKEINTNTQSFFKDFRTKLKFSKEISNIVLDLTSTTNAQNFDIIPDLVRLFFPRWNTSTSLLSNFRQTPVVNSLFSEASANNQTLWRSFDARSIFDASNLPFNDINAFLVPNALEGDLFTQFYKIRDSDDATEAANHDNEFGFKAGNLVMVSSSI